MPTIAEVEKLALALPDADRATLAYTVMASLPDDLAYDVEGYLEANRRIAKYERDPSTGMTLEEFEQSMAVELTEEEQALVDSLPGVLHEDDEGLAEAERRDKEMDADPSACLTLEEFKELVRRRFPSWK